MVTEIFLSKHSLTAYSVSDAVPGPGDRKGRMTPRTENRGRENVSLDSLCVNPASKQTNSPEERRFLLAAALLGIEQDQKYSRCHRQRPG